MDIRETVGRTPLFYLRRISRIRGCHIYVKYEAMNAAGSAASRVSGPLVAEALESGRLQRGGCIVEACMPNMAMALACECAQMDVRFMAVMPDDVNPALLPVLHTMGAEIMLTDAKMGFLGAMNKAEEMRKEIWTSCSLGMTDNSVAVQAHYRSTGPEIGEDCRILGMKPDVFVAAVGTGATLMGAGRWLKEHFGTRLVSVKAADGERGLTGLEDVPSRLYREEADESLSVTVADAVQSARRLLNIEAVCGGISTGACLHAALQLSFRPEMEGGNIIIMGYDSGERYAHRHIFGRPSRDILLNALPSRA